MSVAHLTELLILLFSSQLLFAFGGTIFLKGSKSSYNYTDTSPRFQYYSPNDDINAIKNESKPHWGDKNHPRQEYHYEFPSSRRHHHPEVTTSVMYQELNNKPSRIVHCPMATILNFARVGLKRIGDAFIDSPETRELYLNENNISEISSTAFARLNQLEILSLSTNNIPTNKLLWFTTHHKLQKLILDDNRHEEYSGSSSIKETFQPLPRLEELSLKRNGISSFNVDLNNFAPRLKKLHLSGNNMNELDFLDDLPDSLSHLHLDDNQITKVRSNGLTNITELSVSGNQIEKLCSDQCFDSFLSLKSMKKLRRLNVSRNNIEEVANDAFQDTKYLTVLDLSRNKIRKLPVHVPNTLSELEWLSLSHNLLGSVPKICSLNRLMYLDLSNNNIGAVTNDDLCDTKLHRLHTLILSGNHITEVDNNIFIQLPALKILDLSNNLILNLPVNLIRGARSLQTLLLKDNSIANINELFSITSTVLQKLHLQGNPISIVKYSDMSLLEVHLKDVLQAAKNKKDENDLTNNEVEENDSSSNEV